MSNPESGPSYPYIRQPYAEDSPLGRPGVIDDFQLTPQEIIILNSCNREAVYKRALPYGSVLGLITYYYAKQGPLSHRTYGSTPAAVVASMLGYFVGKLTYQPICFQRLLEVPDGNIRRKFSRLTNQDQQTGRFLPPGSDDLIGDSGLGHVPFDNEPLNSVADLDIATVGSFDTMHTNLEDYSTSGDTELKNAPRQNLTTYEELRRQNRRQSERGFAPPPLKEPPPMGRQPFVKGTSDGSKNRASNEDSWE